jgi:HemY protein
LINYLSAAKAAEEGGSPERRDHYLQLAFDASAGSDVAVRLTQAQLQLDHGDLKQSIRNLERLHEDAPKHPKVLRLLCTLYEALNDWQSLYALLPALKKLEALPVDSIARIEQKVYPALLPFYGEKSLKALVQFWQDSPRSIQTNPKMIYVYAKLLIKKSALPEAEVLLRNILRKTWDNDLIALYGAIDYQHPKKQLSFIEDFLPDHFDNPVLLLAVGRLCFKNQLWGKARDYLERSLAIIPTPETYAALAQLMEQLGLSEKRDEYFKKGLLFATRELVATEQALVCAT